MSDIFISYATGDRPKARLLAETLEQHGWSVWWDRNIPPGESFDVVIEEAMDAAKCIVVLWSGKSVTSDWVKTEAAEGVKRGILVPALIENVKIPLEFRRIQAADLSDWQGTAPHPEFDEFLRAVSRKLEPVKPPKPVRVSFPIKEQWSAELLEQTYSTRRALRVRLAQEAHLVEYRKGILLGAKVEIDGRTVAKYGATTVFPFEISDGEATRAATFQVKHHWFTDRIIEFRLSIDGRTLYAEGGVSKPVKEPAPQAALVRRVVTASLTALLFFVGGLIPILLTDRPYIGPSPLGVVFAVTIWILGLRFAILAWRRGRIFGLKKSLDTSRHQRA